MASCSSAGSLVSLLKTSTQFKIGQNLSPEWTSFLHTPLLLCRNFVPLLNMHYIQYCCNASMRLWKHWTLHFYLNFSSSCMLKFQMKLLCVVLFKCQDQGQNLTGSSQLNEVVCQVIFCYVIVFFGFSWQNPLLTQVKRVTWRQCQKWNFPFICLFHLISELVFS